MKIDKSAGYACLSCPDNHPLEAFVIKSDGYGYARSGRCSATDPRGGGLWFPVSPGEVHSMNQAEPKPEPEGEMCFRCRKRRPLRDFHRGVQDGVRVRSARCRRHPKKTNGAWLPVKGEDES